MLTEMQLAARALFPAFTGDESHTLLYVVIGILAIVILVLLAFKDKIFKKEQEGTEDSQKQEESPAAKTPAQDGSEPEKEEQKETDQEEK